MLYTREQVATAMKLFLRELDIDGTRQALEDMIAQGRAEIVGIAENGEFLFAFPETVLEEG